MLDGLGVIVFWVEILFGISVTMLFCCCEVWRVYDSAGKLMKED